MVKIEEYKSSSKSINVGILQGTILGPLFFILFINVLLSLCPRIMSYTDDTVILSIENDWSTTESNMNGCLQLVGDWFNLNKLTINVDKTVYMTFGCYADSLPSILNISINGKTILFKVDNYKYLGVLFDSNLNRINM